MLFKDQVDFVSQHIKKNKLRVFMTVLAATMGCAFLIVLASIGFGIQDTMRKEILEDQAITEVEVYTNNGEALDISQISEVEHVNAIVHRTSMDIMAVSQLDERSLEGNMLLTNFVEEEKSNLQLSEGRMPTKENEIVVGYQFAENLLTDAERKEMEKITEEDAEPIGGYKESLIGKTISMSMQSYEMDEAFPEKWDFTIVGVTEKPARDWFVDTNMLVDESWKDKFQEVYEANAGNENPDLFYSSTKIYTSSLEHVKSVTEELKEMGYSVYSVSEQLEQLDVFFMAFKIGLIFVGTIAVLIASIGIFNTMTMAVTERTREIGVMKAIGASPKLIQRLFLMESAWIGIIGTVLAVIISYAVSFLANWILPMVVGAALGEDEFQDLSMTFSLIPWQLVVIASVISISVAMISGWRPARKATKIDVIHALRQEL
ncbi:ABC transporter permease [Psychrobacillus lasiicapitis]|uniref:ABC transporter permease n=1 Tax=Psychrobacillus lasiicapitis TaxID=1636719 RepID=A0A544T576_9BACI|nr:FtsX-like permease family protein [Psychrobacillus lasiicapitis]TQR12595.1 ABC transporter permease [Psychrobacillus lasiicapitis]GGA39418.1 ABC transporter permease YtrF [Psychrobacillus lasiicapitis]